MPSASSYPSSGSTSADVPLAPALSASASLGGALVGTPIGSDLIFSSSGGSRSSTATMRSGSSGRGRPAGTNLPRGDLGGIGSAEPQASREEGLDSTRSRPLSTHPQGIRRYLAGAHRVYRYLSMVPLGPLLACLKDPHLTDDVNMTSSPLSRSHPPRWRQLAPTSEQSGRDECANWCVVGGA